jgi:uncharacterized membrane protein
VLLFLAGVVLGSIWLVLAGIVGQYPTIADQVTAGLGTLDTWLEERGGRRRLRRHPRRLAPGGCR